MTEESNTGEISFSRPKTAQEEAAAAEKAKRDAEMEELRRLRAEQAAKDNDRPLSSAEAAKKKREEEMEELRRLKGKDMQDFRKNLESKGGSLTTDMDAWRSNQSNAKQADRQNKLAAQSNLSKGFQGNLGNLTAAELDRKHMTEAQREAERNLHGFSGNYDTKTAATLDKEKMSQAQKDQTAAMAGLDIGRDNYAPDVTADDTDGAAPAPSKPESSAAAEPAKKTKSSVMFKENSAAAEPAPKARSSVMFKDAPAEEIPRPSLPDKLRVSFKGSTEKNEEEDETKEAAAVEEKKSAPPSRQLSRDMANPTALPGDDGEDGGVGGMKLKPPTYSRVDIKFSFGLIVRSSAADGFDGENLRDNETLRKCMDGTHKILLDQMSSPPNMADLSKKSSFVSFKIKWPEAYYDSAMEPTVISIEEDKKEDGKKTAKGNKRTLVKASFPVFLRDEAEDEEGDKRSARILKETKTTVFKALRAAVSGGSFLR